MTSFNGSLYQRSLQVILENQAPSGAYMASPNFPVYQYCWFRDGSYTAYAMDLARCTGSAARFHNWAAQAIIYRKDIVNRVVDKVAQGESLSYQDILRTRYTLDGQDDSGSPDPESGEITEWMNFQLDGFGAWLWALEQHCGLSGVIPTPAWLEAAGHAAGYLQALWKQPCYDCWEEFPDRLHTHTLASIYGGLKAYASLCDVDEPSILSEIREFILAKGVINGAFTKSIGIDNVDASLLGLATPYQVISPDHSIMVNTVANIEARLKRGGVRRYPEDTYYGGGEWVLLAGWLGWHYTITEKWEKAASLLTWMEQQADEQGDLPEQVPATLIDPAFYQPWVERWGPIAKPLLWSHAMYVILAHKIQNHST